MFDPLIHLRLEDLQGLEHAHLYSELDPESSPSQAARFGLLSGSTEWASEDRVPALSFSWDWDYDRQGQRFEAHWSTLRTNLRVVDADGTDLGVECTRLCVARLMTRASWEQVIAQSLGLALLMPFDVRH